MKKIVSIILTLVMCFSLAACGGTADTADTTVQNPTGTSIELVYPFGLTNAPMRANELYPYKTKCYEKPEQSTTGAVQIVDYTVEPVADMQGMVDKTVKAHFYFFDMYAYIFGMSSDVLYMEMNGDTIIGNSDEWTVTVDGKDYTIEVLEDSFYRIGWSNGVYESEYTLKLRMPENYDEMALLFYNSANKAEYVNDEGGVKDGTDALELIDSDTQWFVLGGINEAEWTAGDFAGTPSYYDTYYETGDSDLTLKRIYAGDLFVPEGESYDFEAPPPIFVPLEGTDTETDINDDEYTDDTDADINEDIDTDTDVQDDEYISEEDDDSFISYTDTWVEITDVTVDAIDGNGGYQPVNLFIEIHGWDDTLQARYRCYSAEDGTIGEFTLPAMENGSVTYDVTGTDLKGDMVTFEITLLDMDGFEISASYTDIPVER